MPSAYERFLGELAVATGGRVRNGDAGGGLGAAFQETLEQFRARYEITYEPTSRDGEERKHYGDASHGHYDRGISC